MPSKELEFMRCYYCKGDGVVTKVYILDVVNANYVCPICEGSGEITSDYLEESESEESNNVSNPND